MANGQHNQALINLNGTIGRGSVGTDLNAIPSTAIDRVEVLRDGASSQYGSDAIAGVINLRLKEQPGTTVNAQLGQQYKGDGQVAQVGINHGLKLGEKGFLSLTGEFRHRGATNRAGDYTGPGLRQLDGQPADRRNQCRVCGPPGKSVSAGPGPDSPE